MFDWWIYLVVCAGALFAGFIDAIVGGGGLIQVPMLLILFPGFTHVQVIATNRFASVAGTAVAAYQYIKLVGIDVTMAIVTGIAAATASFSGTFVMERISPEVFKPLLLVVIIVLAVYTFLKKDLGTVHELKYSGKTFLAVCATIGAVIGFYNGFIGPGTGSLLVFAFVSIAGMNFLKASSGSKLINAVADTFSLIGFLLHGAVVFKLALPMMACNMLGGYLGSRTAVLKGNLFIRYVFLAVITLLILRFGRDVVMNWK